MELYLVRHGHTEPGPDGLYPEHAPLSPLGRQQARALLPVLRRIAPGAVVTSGVRRADETAAPYLEECGLEPVRHAGFDEIDPGGLRSLPPEARAARLTSVPHYADFSEYGGESSSEFERRVMGAFRETLADRLEGERPIAAVIHGGPIHVILDYAEGRRFEGTLARAIEPASVSLLRVEGSRLRVEYQGDTSHLAGVSPAGPS